MTLVKPRLFRPQDVSITRLNVMRVMFFLNFAFLGSNFVMGVVKHAGPWESGLTVAYSFWACLAVLSGAFGLRHPQKMTPLLIAQFTYKVIWLLVFYLPGTAPAASELRSVMALGALADLVVIPWPYVLSAYVLAPGERWR